MEPSDVATVLEKAADLYESETIDWCKGAWGRKPEGGGEFHCAEGAILRAAGYSIFDIINAQNSSGSPLKIDDFIKDPLVDAAFRAVAVHKGLDRLWSFNDYVLDAENPEASKQEIINVFKETAKGLRNGE